MSGLISSMFSPKEEKPVPLEYPTEFHRLYANGAKGAAQFKLEYPMLAVILVVVGFVFGPSALFSLSPTSIVNGIAWVALAGSLCKSILLDDTGKYFMALRTSVMQSIRFAKQMRSAH